MACRKVNWHPSWLSRLPHSETVLVSATSILDSQIVTPLNSPVGNLFFVLIPDVSVLGCYLPQRLDKIPFFHRCVERALHNSHHPFVVIGDFNTGRNNLDIEGNGVPFHSADQFAVFLKKVACRTYGGCDTASGATRLGGPAKTGFVSIMLSEIARISIAIRNFAAKLIMSRA